VLLSGEVDPGGITCTPEPNDFAHDGSEEPVEGLEPLPAVDPLPPVDPLPAVDPLLPADPLLADEQAAAPAVTISAMPQAARQFLMFMIDPLLVII
jgi:hypothetical protein